jgi:Na+/proline symporter
MSTLSVYTTSPLIGSPDKMYDILRSAAKAAPIVGNAGGEYLTMQSVGVIESGLIIFVSGWCGIVDLQLFQKAISGDPKRTPQGYIFGGLAWFAIPFCLATTYGLAAVGLEGLPNFTTYPNKMTAQEVSFGLTLPYAAQAVLGTGGAVSIMIMCFMAITSTMSSELVCACSVATFDIYRAYIDPKVKDKALLMASHITIVFFCIICAVISVGLLHSSIGVGYIVTVVGVLVSPAVFPIFSTVAWGKQNVTAVIVSPILVSIVGFAAWLGIAYSIYGEVSIATTATVRPLIIGNYVSFFGPFFYSSIISFIQPQNYDFERMKAIKFVEGTSAEHELSLESEAMDEKKLKSGRWVALGMSVMLLLAFYVLWPLPMYGSGYIFSKPFFRGWVASSLCSYWMQH